ncbi:laminin subunit alpha-1 isoform X1 [Mus caroli]|uniref:Basement membrane-specific heparan sulfate proteoglycan core protein n=1 Tax=Mus caroli TaxID=10089 RepID=A0A6P5R9B7_MUSCR|nr:laminin subunit alpha-1 isoform X1 [Mus caroli]
MRGSGTGAALLVLLASVLWVTVRSQQRGLFPAILNLATNAHISANATCGEKGPEMFCKLVEHVPGRPVRHAQCRVCDGNSTNPRERHPISHAIDGTNNWWQSPSIQNGREYHWVTVTLDLRQVFQVAYIIIKAANAPRPGNWILERSVDGVKFKPWQYYAVSDTECLTRYKITPRRGPPTYRADNEVICTSYYSKLVPLEHGEIHTSLINGRPSADDPSPQLLEFTSARYIRLRLQRIRTLNADLMTLSHRDLRDLDPIVTRRYYYSIKDISVGGMCICYGHASSCPWDEEAKQLQCQCEHNTCGESCDRCCPGYHQQPWRPGTISSGNECEECNCHNKAKDCYYDSSVAKERRSLNTAGQYSGGGVCVNCSQNTTGINCETCIDQYYRPHKVSPYDDHPCRPCDCDPVGSLSSVCIKDDRHADLANGKWPGQCPCRKGYAGDKCDRCQFGYRGFPNCIPCDCSTVGSLNEDPCIEPCLCKKNVEGKNCDRCKPGFYNLKERNPEGCSECFCFGVSDVCDSLTWSISQVTNMSGWLVTDLMSTNKIRSQQEVLGGHRQISINNTAVMQRLTSTYYWAAPEAYLGNKLTAFGGFLKYTVSYDIPVETVDSDLMSHADIIIKGNGLTISTRAEGLSLQPYEEYFNVVRLVPENFRDFNTRREIDRDQLMTVLANVTHLLIRANYNSAKMALYRLDSVSLDIANPNAIDLAVAADVEHCECPQGYTGTSCEACLPGYYRVDGILFGGICQPCECHGHASECDIHGVCSVCTHNTTGDHCDQCLPGFYGTPSRGTPGDCQPCACPLSIDSNNFSPTCHLTDGEEVVCDQCAPGYSGSWCERCADGYYGNPTVPGGTCVPCNCSGNVDPLEAGHCDSVTGECLKCLWNTDGAHCERCADGFYGDAVTAKNCRACNCHENGSLSGVCHLETGLCDCKPHVTGQQCDQCLSGYYGLDTGLGCVPCNCSVEGSVSDNCTEEGQCHCAPGVSGKQCDRCSHGFYAFQDGGCTPCDCAHTQNNCDPASGECLCPPHTQGLKCEECEEAYWGLDPEQGCQACNCSAVGSTSTQCDVLSGHCPCKKGFGGQSCHQCSLGYRSFPDCVPCGCDLRGTLPDTCDLEQGLCSCSEDGGTCSCKENVVGPQCSKCQAGTFALRGDNPQGCSPCFCFGLSQLCSELEGYVRTPITLAPNQPLLHVVSQSNLKGTIEGVHFQPPDTLLDAEAVRQHLYAEPFYWRLPKQFQGDQLLAYGGKLQYSVAFYSTLGTGTSNYEPQVLIKGGRARKHVIYMDAPAPENGVRQDYEVRMKEEFWKYFNSVSEKHVTHSDFMSVLSNIDYILIKASYGQGLQQSRIANISMEVGRKAVELPAEGEAALLLELCVCPPGTAGHSCQDCAPGYYREKLPESGGRGPRPLLGPCVPCSCNNHSDVCDPETGKCLSCRDHTSGDHCDLCASGYYGKVTGLPGDCTPCTCPHHPPFSFSPTCVVEGDSDFRCNACLPGYEGQYCERCSAGYHGNPRAAGGSCQTCDCNPQGSVHSDCDRASGQCVCKPGATGLHCEKCLPRHILMESDCVSCDDDCVGPLLNDLDSVGDAVLSLNLTGVSPAPYGILENLENTTKYFQRYLLMENAKKIRAEIQLEGIAEQTENLQKELTSVLARHQKVNAEMERTSNGTQALATFIEQLHANIKEITEKVATLNQTVRKDFQPPVSALQSMHQNISSLLGLIKERNFTEMQQNATLELKAAKDLLSRIQKRFQKPQEKLKALKEANSLLSNHSEQLQAAEELLKEAGSKTQESNLLLLLVKANLKEFREKKLRVQEEQNVTSELIAKGREWVDAAGTHTAAAQDTLTQLEHHRDELLLWASKIRSHVDDLVMQMSKRRARDLVHRAEQHASELQSRAGALDRDLENVRNVSLNATSAAHVHSNIQTLTEEAETLAADAHKMANQTDLISESLASRGKAVLQRSSRFLKESVGTRRKQQGIKLKLDELKNLTSQFQESMDNITKQANDSLAILRESPGGMREKGRKARELAAAANESAVKTLEDVLALSLRVFNTSEDLSRVNATVQETNDLLHNSTMTTLLAGRKMKDMEMQANLLLDRLKPLKTLEENLSKNLSEIKLLISRARKQAASIKVAVSADRDCVRAYQPQTSSTNYNTLILNVKTQEPDNLLFYLGSSSSSDFLAVEMRRGKVAFLWDLGSGSTRLEFPEVSINNNRWHSIYITRFGNMGSLSVKEASAAENPPVRTSKSPGPSKVLDINNSTLMFVGGLGGQIKKSPAVKVTHFKGCMGEAFLNGKSIGLWNYIEREGKCNGCFGSSQNEDSSFHFDGSGYAVVEKTLRPTVTQIIILFSTFSPNGLLFYLASNGTKDFLSIELVRGRVKVMVDLGSGPLTLMTDRRYNNGTWYKIAFQRNRKQGLLAVFDAYDSSDKETKQGETPGAASDLNRLEKDLIYVGGLPHSKAVRKGVSSRSYVGCIKNLEISRSTFDLLRNSYGVRKGCALEPIQSVSFLRGGYVEMPPKSLSPESSLLATFATKNSSGILLVALGKDAEESGGAQAHVPFFSIMLIEGRIEVHVNSGDGTSLRKALLHAPTGSYSDGQEHSISLVRNRRVITIQLDENSPVEMKLGPLTEGKTINISNLYIGGLPEDKGTPMLKMRTSFHGCIKNVVLDTQLLDFTHATGSEQVELDTCLLVEEPMQSLHREHGELPPEPPTLPQPELCAVDTAPGYVAGAHQFGLSQNSHMVLPLNQSDVRKRLQVQLSIRTFASSGLIYYVAHQNQMDYATLQLQEGRLHFMFDLGKGRTKVSHPALLSDGKWHTVKTEYIKRKAFMTVDGQESPSVTVVGNATTLDVERKLYLGGLPSHYRARNIGTITHSIPACIGEMMVNGQQLDKDRPLSASAVDRCYVVAQEGTFFEGSGYAALVKEGYKVRLDLNITLEFRTSSKNGVLLGISSAKVDAIGLEIVDGKVLFHVNNGAGRITATYQPRAARALCDGKWHTLQAHKSKHRIVLTVDGNAIRAESPHTHSTSADTNDPIYVGGYPAHVKQNCLSSRASFRGCVRNLRLSRGSQVQSLDLSRAFDLQGVFPHSCPGPEP